MNENEQNNNNFDLLELIVNTNALNSLVISLEDIIASPGDIGAITPNSKNTDFSEANKAIEQYNKIIRLIDATQIISNNVLNQVKKLDIKISNNQVTL